ncbi:MAG TPA: FecR domain-containing protein [Polyangiaceae bacterium]
MNTPLYARIASKLLARQERTSASPPTAANRAAAISAIEQAIAARARSRRRNRWLASLAVAATVALAAAGAVHEMRHRSQPLASSPTVPSTPAAAGEAQVVGYAVAGAASVVSSGGSAPLSERRMLPAGSRVVTPPGGHVMLAFATGTDVALGEAADMTIAEEGVTQALRLDHGSLDLHVAKLSADQRFLVETPDAEVEVRGTAFKVSLVPPDAACGAGTPTRVTVGEGVVVVRHAGVESRVETGQQWPSGCAQPVAATRPASGSSAARALGSVAPASSLGEQNDMFADAMAAKRRGDSGEALADFDRFLARYPASPLAESATVERMRLLRGADPGRAAVAARQYLGRYPNGFARAEAETILGGTSAP